MDTTNDSQEGTELVQDDLHDRLCYYFETLSKPWVSPIHFLMHVGSLCALDDKTKEIDICSFISGNSTDSHLSDFAYFDRSQFPPTDDLTKVSPLLHEALTVAARAAGFNMTGNGSSYTKKSLSSRKKFPHGSTPPLGSITYLCARYDRYEAKSKNQKDNSSSITHKAQQYRGVSLHNNDKGNSRGLDGKKGPRKSNTSKAGSEGETCKFRLTVFWDYKGHYVQRGAGHTIHCKHMRRFPKDIPLSVRRWGDNVKEDVGKLSKGRITPASLRNYLRSVHGIVASRQQCRYASRICDADDERYYFGEQPGADGLLGYFEKHKDQISYCVWQAQRLESEVPAMERTSNVIFQENNLEGERTFTDLTEMCQEVLHEYQKEMEMLRLRKDQNYFIACGWITNKERRLFRLFPHVVKIDVVKGTNQEDRPLLTASIRTSQGRYVVICRMMLSHERRMSYRWVFCHALPALLGSDHMKNIIVVMTDGDSNKMEELEMAIKVHLPGCRRLRCGWHIIHKGFQ